MLGTYLDYTTPQEMFDQIERRFEEVKPDSPDYLKRSRCVHLSFAFLAEEPSQHEGRIVKVIVAWLKTVPAGDLVLLHRVREFADGPIRSDHKKIILKTIADRAVSSLSNSVLCSLIRL
jgi:hypothetical protein